jgi:hypothetical protein
MQRRIRDSWRKICKLFLLSPPPPHLRLSSTPPNTNNVLCGVSIALRRTDDALWIFYSSKLYRHFKFVRAETASSWCEIWRLTVTPCCLEIPVVSIFCRRFEESAAPLKQVPQKVGTHSPNYTVSQRSRPQCRAVKCKNFIGLLTFLFSKCTEIFLVRNAQQNRQRTGLLWMMRVKSVHFANGYRYKHEMTWKQHGNS